MYKGTTVSQTGRWRKRHQYKIYGFRFSHRIRAASIYGAKKENRVGEKIMQRAHQYTEEIKQDRKRKRAEVIESLQGNLFHRDRIQPTKQSRRTGQLDIEYVYDGMAEIYASSSTTTIPSVLPLFSVVQCSFSVPSLSLSVSMHVGGVLGNWREPSRKRKRSSRFLLQIYFLSLILYYQTCLYTALDYKLLQQLLSVQQSIIAVHKPRRVMLRMQHIYYCYVSVFPIFFPFTFSLSLFCSIFSNKNQVPLCIFFLFTFLFLYILLCCFFAVRVHQHYWYSAESI